jgi:hypothetical protein
MKEIFLYEFDVTRLIEKKKPTKIKIFLENFDIVTITNVDVYHLFCHVVMEEK